uniref:hypothetical protein n=1 Tax=Psychromonas aquimarina TaxID=444919 RepID=UPI00048E69AD
MTKFLSKYFKPSQISIIYIVLAIISIFMLTIFFSNASEKKNREYYEKPIKTVISAKETRRIGLDSVNKKVIGLNKETQDLTSKVSKIEADNKKLKSESKSSVALAREVNELKQQLAQQKESAAKAEKKQDEKIKNAVEYALKEFKVAETLNRTTQDPDSSKATPFVKRKQSPDSVFNYGSNSNKTTQAAEQVEYHEADGRSDSLFVVIEEPYSAVEDEAYQIYLPIGSILTGVTVTGMDAPTSAASSESPLPVLIRIKKEAILPNLHNLEEVRECFALMAG